MIGILIIMNQKVSLRRTTVISVSLVAFLVGLFSVKYVNFGLPVVLAVGLLGAFFVLRRNSVVMLILACLSGLTLGMWRGQHMLVQVLQYNKYIGSKVVMTGRVQDDPVYDSKGRQDFRISSVKLDGQSMAGQVRIKTHTNGLRRGDLVQVYGRLTDGFGNYQASMYFAEASLVRHPKNPIESLRRKFFASVYSVLPEPQASLGLGFLVGLRSALPDDFDKQLQIAGLTHIVVASGFNLTILVRLSRRLLAKYSRYQALVGSMLLVSMFLAVTGASASMVRASVVTVLSLLAWQYGRRFQPVMIVLLGAVLTAGFNPLFIWFDIGWWLSFLAFAGVLILAPLLTARYFGKKSPPLLLQVAVETLSAQVMAVPLILFTFGNLSLVALLANIVVVPLIPIAMLATFVAGVAGLALSGGLAAWLAVPAQLVLSYVVAATRFFAQPSWAQRSFHIGAITMTALYVAISVIVIVLRKRSGLEPNKLPSVVE